MKKFLIHILFQILSKNIIEATENMATKTEIEEALNQIKQKFDDPVYKSKFSSYTKNVQFTFTDLQIDYVLKVNKGEVESLKEEIIDSPDIHLIVDSGIFLDILSKKLNPMQAYASGKIKAKGKLPDLLKIQKLL